jgi:hypothetical protein
METETTRPPFGPGLMNLRIQRRARRGGHLRLAGGIEQIEVQADLAGLSQRRQGSLFDPVVQHIGIGDQLTLVVEDPGPLRALDEQQLQRLSRAFGVELRNWVADRRRLHDHVGDEAALGGQTVDLGGDQAATEFVQHQRPADQYGQAKQVQRDDQPAEPGARQAPASLAPLARRLRFRDSGSRRHRGFRSRRTPDRPDGTCAACV